ncbi:hypothetical protein TNCT_509581 [Trichonephila clavata]|uniref:Uncharacterized protein n=1 Tax=Trichonephila clavata TaxID=2740835 RepID=A0A8X6LGB2_TRICU|nr:hypothetical protein TNCT_509581 [Trichonephila clavata]
MAENNGFSDVGRKLRGFLWKEMKNTECERVASTLRCKSSGGPKCAPLIGARLERDPCRGYGKSRVYSSSPKPVLYRTMLTRRVFVECPSVNGGTDFFFFSSQDCTLDYKPTSCQCRG